MELVEAGDWQNVGDGILNSAGPKEFVAIVGAPRCGTTLIARLLQAHPAICFAKVKEPHFFSRLDLTDLSDEALREAVKADYLDRYFHHCSKEHRIIAEGSVSYLYAPEQMRAILTLWPDARFIVAVRDPMQMLPSLHQRLLYQGDESVRDFSRAWELRHKRALGRNIPRTCIDARMLQYEEIARLGKHVSAFINTVSPERCFIAVYDDLAADPRALHEEILAFLDLPAEGDVDFYPRRARKGFKLGWLQRLLKRPPVATRSVLAGTKYRRRVKPASSNPPSAFARQIIRLRKHLLRWNRAEAPEPNITQQVRREICESLKADISQLSELVGRDLRHWLDGSGLPQTARRTSETIPPELSEQGKREVA